MNTQVSKLKKILFVEDDTVEWTSIKDLVKRKQLPYQITSVASVKESLELLDKTKFDLTILDFILEDGTSFDVIPRLNGTPFIVVSAMGSEETAVRTMKSGASDYLVKDFEGKYINELPKAIESALISQELKEYKNSLEKNRAELIPKLDSINKNLLDFSEVISHDLKAPLRSINTLACWLENDYFDKFDNSGREKISLLKDRVKHMYLMVENFLKFSSLSLIHREITLVDLPLFIEDFKKIVSIPNHIEIIFRGPVLSIEASTICLKHIFQNLIINSINFMDKSHGKIEIFCKDEEKEWQLSVRDNGPGISTTTLDGLSSPAINVPYKDYHKDESGLGLSIVRKLVQNCGGKLWVDSKLGENTEFFFTIPKKG